MAKKVITGKVVSNKMQKTVVVEVERFVSHPIYKKRIKKTNKIKADTNGMEVSNGVIVKIEQTSPISRDKFFKVVEIVREGEAK